MSVFVNDHVPMPECAAVGMSESAEQVPPQRVVSEGRKIMAVKTLVLSCACAVVALGAVPALASPDKPVIALSNAYYGNTWRHQMVDAFEAAAKQAKADGKIADYIILNGDGSVAQQNSQLAELILKKVDAIPVDAASETALNGVIE